MRILLVTQWWEPDEGPPQWRLRRFVDAFRSAGHTVDVVTAPPHYPGGRLSSADPAHQPGAVEASAPGLTVYRTRFREHTPALTSRVADQLVVVFSSFATGLRLRARGHRADVVMTSVPALPSAAVALALARLHRAPFVVDLRDAWPDLVTHVADTPSAQPNASAASRFKGTALRSLITLAGSGFGRILKRADLVVTTSDLLRDDLERRGIHPVVTIRNAPVTAFDSGIAPHKPTAGALGRELRVLYAGTIGRAQGLHNAVLAAKRAQLRGADILLRIIGTGSELDTVRTFAERIAAPVEFLPPVPHADMTAHFDWCDASLIHLRDWRPLRTTVPSKLFESMARGVPVIVAADGETAAIVDDASAGISVPAMDSLALARAFHRCSAEGPPKADFSQTHEWLKRHSSPESTSALLVRNVESLVFPPAAPSTTPLRTRANSIASLVGNAVEIGINDPILLATLVSRRVPPHLRRKITHFSGSVLRSPSLRGIALVIGDEKAAAREQYDSARQGKLRDWLGVHLNEEVTPTSARSVRARRAWAVGDTSRALSLVRPHSATARRWRSTLHSMDPDFDPGADATPLITQSRRTRDTIIQRAQHAAGFRVLHVITNSLPHTQSGYTLRTQSLLSALHSYGVTSLGATRVGYPQSIGVPTAQEYDDVGNVLYVRIPSMRSGSMTEERLEYATQALAAIVEDFRPQVIHATTNFENGVVARSLSRRTGIPWVYETRGEMEKTWLARQSEDDYAAASQSDYYLRLRSIEARLMSDADAVVALSEVQKSSHIARGVAPERVHVVPNSVDAQALESPTLSSPDAREACGLPEGFTVGSISSLVDYEGLDTLLRALAWLRDRGHGVRGVIVGDGSARPDLLQLRDHLGLSELVTMPGRVSASDIGIWYDALDVFCVPRRDVDVTRAVTPLKPLQAMARSRPVIVSDLEALTEITSSLGAGIAIPAGDPDALADAIASLRDDSDLYTRLACGARAAAEAKSWDRAATRLLDIYSRLSEANR